ncbi:MAG: hypothetical protein J0I18_05840 [Actinobacteria bacterium]|nr:hypothetical protein [Actinomycetota bacterium]
MIADAAEVVSDWAELVPKRAYVLLSPDGDELLSTYGGPGEEAGAAVFFAHAPGGDGEITIAEADGWSVLRSIPGDDGHDRDHDREQ